MCGVQAAELAVRAGVEAGGGAALPGMILNTSKETTYTNAATGREHSVPAGRMECTMQVRPYSHTCYMSIFHLTLQTTAAISKQAAAGCESLQQFKAQCPDELDTAKWHMQS